MIKTALSAATRCAVKAMLALGTLMSATTAFANAGAGWTQVPMTIDNNRPTVEVSVTSAEGKTEKVRAVVDTGNPYLWISADLAKRLGLWRHTPNGNSPIGKVYLVETPRTISISGFELQVPRSIRGIAFVSPSVYPGMNAEINIPAPVLSQAEIEVDYKALLFGLGTPGSGDHEGSKVAVSVDPGSSEINLPVVIDGTSYKLGLDTGSDYSTIDPGLMKRLLQNHPNWPQLTGYLGASNFRGLDPESELHLIRIPNLQWGPLALYQVGVRALIEDTDNPPAGPGDSIGAIGGNVLKSLRVDIDYANHLVYFDKSSVSDGDQIDMVGLVLRPEMDGGYSVLRQVLPPGSTITLPVAAGDRLIAVDGVPVKDIPVGRVIEMLSGAPGKTKELALRHGDKDYTVNVTIERYLPLQ